MQAWFAYALIALALWGVWGVFANLTARHLDSYSAMIWEVVGAISVALIVLLGFLRVNGLKFDARGTGYGLLTGIVYTAGLVFLFAALRAAATANRGDSPSGHVHTILVVSALYPLVAGLINYGLLDEPLSARQAVGMALGLGAVIIFVTGGE